MNVIALDEKTFLQQYDASQFARPNISVDTVIFTVFNGVLHVLLARRAEHPFKNSWSLVGGYIDVKKDLDLEATAKRKLQEKTGVKTPYLEQYATIGNVARDPRGWSATTVYFALIPKSQADQGILDTKWVPIINGRVQEKLAFDHADILRGCFERLRSKVLYTSLPVYLMPKTFTLSELQKMYETIVQTTLDAKSFRRRIINANILEQAGAMQKISGRPAQLFQLKRDQSTHFFVRTLEKVVCNERA